MKPTCICGQPVYFGRSNVKRCINCHSLQVRDYDGSWIFEYTDPTSGLGASTLFIPKSKKSGYQRSHSQVAFEAGQFEKAWCGL